MNCITKGCIGELTSIYTRIIDNAKTGHYKWRKVVTIPYVYCNTCQKVFHIEIREMDSMPKSLLKDITGR